MKIKISTLKLNYISNYIVVILISALVLSTLFFALPKTEDILPDNLIGENRFDLNTKSDDYWKQEIILSLDTQEKEDVEKKINKTRDIIYKRLKKADAEEIQIEKHSLQDTDGLKVTVQTTKEEMQIMSLISQRSYMMLMTPTEGFSYNPNDPELDVFAVADIENWDETQWDRDSFRNLLIKPLLDGAGDRTYFAIFKPWPQDQGKFARFLKEYEGQYIGFGVDDFVTPVRVEEYSDELFAVGFGPDADRALFYDIAFNTGVIPLKYELEEVNVLDAEIYEINHLQVTLAIIASIIVLTTYLYFRETEKQEKILEFGFSLILVFAISFTFLKLYQIPVDLFLLIIAAILTIIFVKLLYLRNMDTKAIIPMSLGLAILMIFIGSGYIMLLGQYLLFVVLLSIVVERIAQYYFRTIKIIFT